MIFHVFSQINSLSIQTSLTIAFVLSLIGYILTDLLLPKLQTYLFNRGLKGKDLGRTGRPDQDEEIPSAVGVIVGIVFLIIVIILQSIDRKSTLMLINYNAALQSMCFMLLLGFIDDVVDLPWRYKVILPPLGSLPLLCSYSGETTINVPVLLHSLFWDSSAQKHSLLGSLLETVGVGIDPKAAGSLINLGALYYVYMSMLSVFCTNSINIYAGINGLEVGQSIVVAISILITNLYQLQFADPSSPIEHPHLLSAMILICFIGVSIALLKHNWFPARCFVGDTYCYFAGVTFAVVGILGHFSKTLLLYLLPQIINFLLSVPQLFKYYPCPRHRLPGVDKNGLRVPSTFSYIDPKDPEKKKLIVKNNLTLINLVLYFTGPISEEHLTIILLLLQAIVCAVGFALRYIISTALYGDQQLALATTTVVGGV
jgi:UDP-N-acetylglucosamine--dolichyl-phosphate N-acetylglucosaminephosphotransferase